MQSKSKPTAYIATYAITCTHPNASNQSTHTSNEELKSWYVHRVINCFYYLPRQQTTHESRIVCLQYYNFQLIKTAEGKYMLHTEWGRTGQAPQHQTTGAGNETKSRICLLRANASCDHYSTRIFFVASVEPPRNTRQIQKTQTFVAVIACVAGPFTKAVGVAAFAKQFQKKTGNKWDDRATFVLGMCTFMLTDPR